LSNSVWRRNLSVQLLAAVLLSLLAAAAAFGVLYFLGYELIDHTFYSERFAQRMADRQFKRLQDFVTQEAVTTEKLHRLNAWCSRGSGVYLIVYRDGALIYESQVVKELSAETEDYDPEEENAQREYALTFSDGVTAQAFLYYYASEAFYFWMVGVSGLLAFAVFSLCFIVLVNRKVRYIKRLKTELDILSGGDMEHPVTVRGQDELGELAIGIDEMRRSILNHQRSEAEIRSANSQLVTAMSHDLRTPLTSLLAFLEVLDRDKASDEEQRRHLIRQSLDKAMNIKSMADKLFEYFLVYTSEWEDPEKETRDADELMQQFWQEYAFALESHGFTVATDFSELNGTVNVNLELLRRAFDNLYANLVKYADDTQPIRIVYGRDAGQIRLTLSNGISKLRDRKESTNIGLNTCARILRMHSGTFEAAEKDGRFTVFVTLPISDCGAEN
jgi:signal transduction histidine kinase